MIGPEPLPQGECHVWVVRVEAALAAGSERYLAWLSSDEQAGLRRYRFERHQREHLVTRALGRAVLSRYTAVPPSAWTFAAGSHGKPFLTGPAPLPPLAFNLANAGDVVVCAVAAATDVGVDVEPVEGPGDPLDLAQTAFSAEEAAALRALPPELWRERFVAIWTLKEAYVKARGLGLALPTQRFSVSLDGAPPSLALGTLAEAHVRFDPAVGDDPARWQLLRLGGIAGHSLAVALRRPAGGGFRVRLRTAVTLELDEA